MQLDDGLVRRALRGDREAFHEVIEQAWGMVFVFVRQRVNDPEIARDLTQDTFLQAFEKRATLREGKSLLPWLLTIAGHKIIDMRRRRSARPEQITAPDALPQTAVEGPAAGAPLDRQADSARLEAALGKLDDLYRTVLILRYWSDLTPGQIARLLEEPEGTIRNRIFRAHLRLRELLEQEERAKRGRAGEATVAAPPLPRTPG